MKVPMTHRVLRALAPRGLTARMAVAVLSVGVLFAGCDVHSPTSPGSLTNITVTPDVTLAVNDTNRFVAVGTDASGAVVTISPVWSVQAGGGVISGTGLFTAGTVPGVYTATVQATNGGISGTATVTVVVGALASINVTPNPDTTAANATQQFTAVGMDGGGNVIAISPTWSVVASGGSIGSSGLFTASAAAGVFTNTVRANSGSISGFATVVVTTAPSSGVIPLGAAETHGILAGSAISCVALGTVNADASVFPGSAFSGFPPCTITGAQHAADTFAQTAQGDLTTAYNALDVMPCSATLSSNLGGQTLQPGVYCSTSTQGLTGEMFLNALGDPDATFVIKVASALTTATAQVTLLNGAEARNIYWLVGSSATLGVGSAMKGNIIALTSITFEDNATLLGRALARNGAVALGSSNVITLP